MPSKSGLQAENSGETRATDGQALTEALSVPRPFDTVPTSSKTMSVNLTVFNYRAMVVVLKAPLTPEEEIAMKAYIDHLRERQSGDTQGS